MTSDLNRFVFNPKTASKQNSIHRIQRNWFTSAPHNIRVSLNKNLRPSITWEVPITHRWNVRHKFVRQTVRPTNNQITRPQIYPKQNQNQKIVLIKLQLKLNFNWLLLQFPGFNQKHIWRHCSGCDIDKFWWKLDRIVSNKHKAKINQATARRNYYTLAWVIKWCQA